ncbi:MAG TPA: hypothetical protein VL175_19835 [Pirellulales bacterium]|jgi:hypothetical protein|nr:hypothetical protein [Pirellulales bacterium]
MTAPKRRWFRFSLRTLFVVVTMVAASCWVYLAGWPRWQLYREQSDFEESVKQLRAGMTPNEGSNLARFETCVFKGIALGQTPASEQVVFNVYSWPNACYCICYILSGPPMQDFNAQKTDRIEVYCLPPVPVDYKSPRTVSGDGNPIAPYVLDSQSKMFGDTQSDELLVHSDG